MTVLWKDRIHDGSFIVWTYANQDGEKATGAASVHTILQTIVLNRYKYTFDFTKGLSESQLKLTQPKPVSRYGMGNIEIKGLIAGCEKSVLGKVWNRENYWTDPSLEKEPISIIKNALVKIIDDAFMASGRISIDEIYDFLETQYGFSPCNLSAFIVGFLLRDYSNDPYRFQDSEGHRESMTPDKLSEMVGNYMSKKAKTTYIVSLTDTEKAFYEMTEEAWRIPQNTCSSPTQAGTLIQAKMREFVYPVWCLSEVDTLGVFDIVKKYIALVQSDGQVAHDIANDLGKIALQRQSSAQNLMNLLTADNCQKGMALFLEHFENGKFVNLAKEIGATDHMLSDIKRLFSIKHSAQWIAETGEDEIRKLIVEYEVVKSTNILLNVSNHSKDAAFKSWRETLKFIGFSCESVRAKTPSLAKVFDLLFKIANFDDMLPENMQQLLTGLTDHIAEMRDLLDDTLGTFMEIYAPYLEGFSRVECEEIKDSIKVDMFTLSATKSNAEVKKAAEDYRKGQVKDQLFKLWSDKTGGTKNPRQWSEKYKTPILSCINANIYSDAKKAFSVLNSSAQTEAEIKSALAFLQEATFFEQLEDPAYRDQCFIKRIVGYYVKLLPNIGAVRAALDALSVDAYDWSDDPSVQAKIKSMASAEYNAGGSDEAKKVIDEMDDIEQLKDWLKKLIGGDMELGVKIISNGGQ